MPKGLSRFTVFDHEAFLSGLGLVVIKEKDWTDQSGRYLGRALTIEIAEDKPLSAYPKNADGSDPTPDKVDNYHATISVHVPAEDAGYLARRGVTLRKTPVRIVDVQRTSVWGEYRNNLTIVGHIVPVQAGKSDNK